MKQMVCLWEAANYSTARGVPQSVLERRLDRSLEYGCGYSKGLRQSITGAPCIPEGRSRSLCYLVTARAVANCNPGNSWCSSGPCVGKAGAKESSQLFSKFRALCDGLAGRARVCFCSHYGEVGLYREAKRACKNVLGTQTWIPMMSCFDRTKLRMRTPK
jgi:hypothetical protein